MIINVRFQNRHLDFISLEVQGCRLDYTRGGWPAHYVCNYDSTAAQKLDLQTLKLWGFQWDSFLEDDQSWQQIDEHHQLMNSISVCSSGSSICVFVYMSLRMWMGEEGINTYILAFPQTS